MRLFLILLSFPVLLFSQETEKKITIEQNQLGFSDSKRGYGYFDGGLMRFVAKIENIKHNKLTGYYTIEGCITDRYGEVVGDLELFKGTNDKVKKEIIELKFFSIDVNGCFKIKSKLSLDENLYISSVGFSILEILIDSTPNSSNQKD
jgi:hypothetical protein